MPCFVVLNRPPQPRRTGPFAPRQQQRGSAVVEFALILPILLVLLLGTIEGSLALYNKAVITNASREGARAGIVAGRTPQSDADISQVVTQYTDKALITFASNKTGPVVRISEDTLDGQSGLRVTVSYTFQGLGLGGLLEEMGKPIVMSASTVMLYE